MVFASLKAARSKWGSPTDNSPERAFHRLRGWRSLDSGGRARIGGVSAPTGIVTEYSRCALATPRLVGKGLGWGVDAAGSLCTPSFQPAGPSSTAPLTSRFRACSSPAPCVWRRYSRSSPFGGSSPTPRPEGHNLCRRPPAPSRRARLVGVRSAPRSARPAGARAFSVRVRVRGGGSPFPCPGRSCGGCAYPARSAPVDVEVRHRRAAVDPGAPPIDLAPLETFEGL